MGYGYEVRLVKRLVLSDKTLAVNLKPGMHLYLNYLSLL